MKIPRRWSKVRAGPISGRLVIQQNKFDHPEIRKGTVIDLPDEDAHRYHDWLRRYRKRRCTPSKSSLRRANRKVAVVLSRKPKIKGPFIGDWGFALMLKQIQQRKKR